MQEQRGLILHIMQGSYEGSISWGKNPASGVSFHFATAKDGRCGQLVDTDVTAWTQVQGNGHWLSVENEDFNTNPLSPPQLEKVAQIYARGVRTYGWPLQSTDSVNGRGLGWHGMGGAAWGNHPFCPGEPIKAQRPAILARAAQILGGSGPVPATKGDTDMFRLIDPEGGQFIIQVNPLSETGFSYVTYGQEVQPQIQILTSTGAIPTVDARTNPNANGQWRPGVFGPETDVVRQTFIDTVAAAVLDGLPPGNGGEGLTEAEVKAAVRAELDNTKLSPQ